MRNRIVSIVLALSLLAAVYVALPTSAAVDYTGSVQTTDNAKAPKDIFVRGQDIHLICEVLYQGYPSPEDIEVRLESFDGDFVSNIHVTANVPDDGWYNSTETGAADLPTAGASIPDGDRASFYVIMESDVSGEEIARTTVTILRPDLWLEPEPGWGGFYTPGQALTAKLITTFTGDILYVHTVNATGVDVAGMNWSTVIAPTGYWERAFVLSAEMPDGEYTMKVRDSTSHALRHTEVFSVQKYYFAVELDRAQNWPSYDQASYLPGEVVKMEVTVIDMATYSPVPTVTVRYWAQWNNFSANGSAVFHTWQNGTVDTSMGIWEFTIPTDVVLYDSLYFMFWANESAVRSAMTEVWLDIAAIQASVDVPYDDYVPGDTVVVTTEAWLEDPWYDYPLDGANVDVVVLFNNTAVDAYGNAGMITADDGTVTYTFSLADDAPEGIYIVKATVSKVGFSVVMLDQFEVFWWGYIDVNLNKDYYYTGESVSATMVPMWNGAVVEVSSMNYAYGTDDGILATGTTEDGLLEFDLPEGYHGNVWVDVTAVYEGNTITGGDGAQVRIADLALIAENDMYRPGDTLVFNWLILTNLEDGTLEWELIDLWSGVKVAGDAPAFETSGSFEFEVPTDNPSPGYGATIWMTTADGGYAEDSFDVWLIGNYELRVWAGASSYTSGEFRPGDTVKLHYSIASYYTEPYPAYELYIWTLLDPIGVSVFVDSNEGTVSYQLPEDTPAGELVINVEANEVAIGFALDDDTTVIEVNTKLSGWDRSVAGMAASDFTILILIVVMILLLIIVPLLKSKGVMGKGEEKKAEAPPPTPPQ